jgi:hypothetical protein
VRFRDKQLDAALERGVFAYDPEEPAVLQVALGMEARDGDLVIAQGGAYAIAYGRLH